MTRYEYDIRRPMRRRDDTGSGCGVVIVILLVLGIFGLIGAGFVKHINNAAQQRTPTSVAKARTDDGEIIRVYSVTVDGTEYLVSDRGGLCKKGA